MYFCQDHSFEEFDLCAPRTNVSLSRIFFEICVLILHVVDIWVFDYTLLDRGLLRAWRPTVSARAVGNHR